MWFFVLAVVLVIMVALWLRKGPRLPKRSSKELGDSLRSSKHLGERRWDSTGEFPGGG
jgi:hypothetical protein